MSKKNGKPGNNKNNKKKGPLGGGPKPGNLQAQAKEFERLLGQSERLWKTGDIIGALEILENLQAKNRDDVRPVLMTSLLYAELGEAEAALEYAQLAERLEPDEPLILNLLVGMYILNGREGGALQTLRRLRASDQSGEFFNQEMRERMAALEEILKIEATELKVPAPTLEKAMQLMETGVELCSNHDFEQGFSALQQAANLIPGWTPPRINLSLFQYEAGQAEEAISTVQKVVDELDPSNLAALSHLTTILAWTGQKDRAEQNLEKLNTVFEKEVREIETLKEEERAGTEILYFKMAGALAALHKDQQVYDILKRGEKLDTQYDANFYRWLATAAYNLGKLQEATTYWQKFEPSDQTAFDTGIQQAMQRKRPADAPPLHLPYFETSEFVPMTVMSQLLALKESDTNKTMEFDEELIRVAYAKYSQFYPIKEALLQNANFGLQPVAEANIGIMGEIRTPEITSMLKEYALAYTGAEATRRYAVAFLVNWGELPENAQIRFWSEQAGEWQDLEVSSFASLEDEDRRILGAANDFIETSEDF